MIGVAHREEIAPGGRPVRVTPRRTLPWLHRPPMARWEWRFLGGLLVLLALLLLPLLNRVPRAYGDDSWKAMAGYTLAFEGRPRNPGQMGRGGADTFLVEPRLLPNVICAGVYRLAGFGLTQGRVATAMVCAVFVLTVWTLTRRLFGPVAASAVAVMTAIDPWVFICGRTCREEIFLAALLWLSWLLLADAIDRRSAICAWLGGLCIGLACWTHPNAVVFTAAALVGLVATTGLGRLKEAWLLWAFGGIVVGLAPYVLYVGYVQSTTDIRLLDQVTWRIGAYARSLADTLATEKERWVNFLRLPLRTPLLLLYLCSAGWALRRGQRGDRLLLVTVAASALLMPVWQNLASGRYYVVLVPALTALVWRWLSALNGRALGLEAGAGPRMARTWIRRTVAIGGLAVYAAMSLAPTLAVVYAHRRADYDHWAAAVAQYVPPHGRVMGHIMYWTPLHDRQFISNIPPYFSDWRSVDNAVAHIQKYRPEYLIQSSTTFAGLDGLGPRTHDLRATFCGRACEEVAARVPARVLTEFYHRDFGAVRLWQLQWPAEEAAAGEKRR